MAVIEAIQFKDGVLKLIDQRKLPTEFTHFTCETLDQVEYAIRDMVVRGAPAIGATAAYGMTIAAQAFEGDSYESFLAAMEKAQAYLNNARPTAVNLMWATDRIVGLIKANADKALADLVKLVEEDALRIQDEDVATNKQMGAHGNEVIQKGATILTHCNTGALATAGWGTALGVVRSAHYDGKDIFVYADETRPRLQGGRLTAWELVQENIPAKLIADNTAATLIRDGKIDVILVGADRVAVNGDSANKIGTFMLSVVAKAYNVPFYIVAPTTTIDFDMETGDEIEIEERSAEEVTHVKGVRTAPEGIDVYNPAFDVTPAENITGIITEKGIARPPFKPSILTFKEA